MKVTLNIENDAELRAYIKDLIKGQVLSVTREEINTMVATELIRKLKDLNQYAIELMIKKAAQDTVTAIFNKEIKDIVGDGKVYAQTEINKRVGDTIDRLDIKKLVNDAAKKMVDALVQKL